MTAQSIRITRTGNLFWLWWTFAAVLGFTGGMAIKTAIETVAAIGGLTALLDAIPSMLFGTLLGAMLGGATGLAQWLVLRRRLRGVGAWVVATLAAYTLFWTLHNSGLLPFAHTPWGFVVQGVAHGAIVGGMLGLAQWLALRRHLPGAWRWILISVVSWSMAGAITHFLLRVLFAAADLHGPYDILLVSTLAALCSGIALQRLLQGINR